MATLGFMTKWPKEMGGGNTEFIPKIWDGIIKHYRLDLGDLQEYENEAYSKFDTKGLDLFDTDYKNIHPKLHTIRYDPNNRWKTGMKIHMVIFNRSKNRFQFAPILECKSVQEIQINQCNVWYPEIQTHKRRGEIFIDEKIIEPCQYRSIALNDGFESVKHFFQYFNTNTLPGTKIINWTD